MKNTFCPCASLSASLNQSPSMKMAKGEENGENIDLRSPDLFILSLIPSVVTLEKKRKKKEEGPTS